MGSTRCRLDAFSSKPVLFFGEAGVEESRGTRYHSSTSNDLLLVHDWHASSTGRAGGFDSIWLQEENSSLPVCWALRFGCMGRACPTESHCILVGLSPRRPPWTVSAAYRGEKKNKK